MVLRIALRMACTNINIQFDESAEDRGGGSGHPNEDNLAGNKRQRQSSESGICTMIKNIK